MKLVLDLAIESDEERQEALEYVAALQRAVERRIWQGFPGAIMEMSDASIWVSSVEVKP